jgi:hypothetical protein
MSDGSRACWDCNRNSEEESRWEENCVGWMEGGVSIMVKCEGCPGVVGFGNVELHVCVGM